ncbi:MAG: helix-turn-helix transcriptional regulator [Clostridia bacterium]|nr:helix-turn-helix transcriptional regulator [Clostridia bacterium]
MKFTNPLYEYRRALGYSQPDIVALANVSQSALSKWESGQCTPDGNTLKKISNFLEVPVSYLCGYNDYEERRNIRRAEIDDFLNNLDGHDRRRIISIIKHWEEC